MQNSYDKVETTEHMIIKYLIFNELRANLIIPSLKNTKLL